MRVSLQLLAVAFAFSTGSYAQTFPTKPLRIVVPFAPGGANDVIARVVGQRLTEALGQPVLVDNRGGAGGAVGAELVARAPADGYVLLLANPGPNAINPALQAKAPYDPVKDFAPITLLAVSPQVLVVHPSLPARSPKDLVALARAKPGQISYGSSGTGAITHLSMELFKSRTRTQMIHVPYKGASPSLTGLASGEVSAMFAALGSIQNVLDSKRIRLVAVASKERTRLLPNVPTLAEGGIPDFEVMNWFGIVGPAATPRPIVDRLNQALNNVVQAGDTQERFAALGFIPRGTSPEAFGAHIRSEISRWTAVIKAQSIQAE